LKNNNLSNFEKFPGKCDILSVADKFYAEFFIRRIYTYILASRIIYAIKTPKIQKILLKSTENIFSVDFKSTINFHKTSKTRYQLTSLF